ncbi:MAG: hypothetical protein E7321_08515 [Clostridiales bacterium]|nr:hypothetical protein [Clostridiales bacterium]
MTRKRWCFLTAAMLVLSLALIVALVVIVDPFEIYHRALFYNPPYESETQMYSGAGVAKSYTYDSIIVGSSMTENCTPSVYDDALGGRFVKLSMNAGLSLDHAKMMEIAFRTHEVRRVVYGMDFFSYTHYYNNQKAKTPDYLYDDSLFNDVQYWLNKSVLFSHIPAALARVGTPDEDASRDSMYFWHPPEMPGEAALRARVNLSAPMPDQTGAARGVELAQLSLEHNLLPFIRAHRDTTFTVFLPPYSLLYWADQAVQGNLDTCIAQKTLMAKTLLHEPNVELFDFQARFDWVEDYDLYYDLIHYISVINDEMAYAMADGACRVTDMAQIEESNRALLERVHALFPQ